ncbi:TRAP transporter small permease [Henriciella litoralis]|uniref:TRAP transporter small permease n=1 Tax=Henriciella litoralis TaxID=568102 RepID=UPI000A06C220|nr:TRAP transporter small permease subunit [Henriciella litoralis]
MSETIPVFSHRLQRVSAWVNTAALVLASVLLCLMVGLVVVQVVARYIFQDAPAWTEEAARYCMVWSALLAASCAFYQGVDPALIKVGQNASMAQKRGARIARFLFVSMFAGTLLFHSAGMLQRASLRHTEALGLNLALVMMVVPVFCLLILFHAAVQLVSGAVIGEEASPI